MNKVLQWENLNRYRRYPFVDDTLYRVDRVGDSGLTPYAFRDDVLLDFKFITYTRADPVLTMPFIDIVKNDPAPPTCDITFILTDGVYEQDIVITLNSNAVFPLVVNTVLNNPLTTVPLYNMHNLFGEGIKYICENWPAGRFYFTPKPVVLPSKISVLNKHRALSIRGNHPDSVYLTNAVYITDGYNTNVTVAPGSNTLTINCAYGAGLGVSCELLPNARKAEDGIISINDALPDTSGILSLLQGAGIEINKLDDHTLQIKTTINDNEINCFKAV